MYGELPVFDGSTCGEEEIALRCMMSWNNRLCTLLLPNRGSVRVKFCVIWGMFSSMMCCSDLRPVKNVC